MTYKWYFGDGDSSTLKNPVHQYTNANNKSVRLVVKGACNSDDTTIITRDFTGVGNFNASEIFRIYPNPTKDYFSLISYLNTPLSVNIYDLSGKLVKQYQGEIQPIFIGDLSN